MSELDEIVDQYSIHQPKGKAKGTVARRGLKKRLKLLLADQQREAKVEVLKSLAKEMDSCNDCPKDEPPSLHILKRLAEGEHAVINKLEYKK